MNRKHVFWALLASLLALAFSLTGCTTLWVTAFPGTFIENDTSTLYSPNGFITLANYIIADAKSAAQNAATSYGQKTQQVYVWQEQGNEYEYDKAALSRGIAEGIFRYGRTIANPGSVSTFGVQQNSPIAYRMIEVRTISTQTVNVSTLDEVKYNAVYEQYVNEKKEYIRQKFAEVNTGNFVELADTDRVYNWRGGSVTGKTLKAHLAKQLQTLEQQFGSRSDVFVKGFVVINSGSRDGTVIVAMWDDNGNLVCKRSKS